MGGRGGKDAMRKPKGFGNSKWGTTDHKRQEEEQRREAEASLNSDYADLANRSSIRGSGVAIFGLATFFFWAWETLVQAIRTILAFFKNEPIEVNANAEISGRKVVVLFGALIRLAIALAILAVPTFIIVIFLKHFLLWVMGGFQPSQLKNL